MATKTIAQLTPNPAPALTDLIEVDDGAGNSFKETLNDVINLTFPAGVTITYAGTLPPTFPPIIEVDQTSGIAATGASGVPMPITVFTGYCSQTPIAFTDPFGSLTTLSFDNLAGLMGAVSFSPQTTANLTRLAAPELIYIGGAFQPSTMASLTTMSFANLTYVGSTFGPTTMASLTTLSFPALTFVNSNFQPSTMASLTTMSFPSLKILGASFTASAMASLTTFSFPVLSFVGGNFTPSSMAALTTISLPALQYQGYSPFGSFSVASMASLATLSLPAMISYNGTITANTGLGNLASVTLGTVGTLKSIVGATINISGQKLDRASVNGILALLVSLDGTGGTTLWGAGKTVNLSGGTSAAPSGQGIIDKATLVARTATVTTN
jgi:hypothetical protein